MPPKFYDEVRTDELTTIISSAAEAVIGSGDYAGLNVRVSVVPPRPERVAEVVNSLRAATSRQSASSTAIRRSAGRSKTAGVVSVLGGRFAAMNMGRCRPRGSVETPRPLFVLIRG